MQEDETRDYNKHTQVCLIYFVLAVWYRQGKRQYFYFYFFLKLLPEK